MKKRLSFTVAPRRERLRDPRLTAHVLERWLLSAMAVVLLGLVVVQVIPVVVSAQEMVTTTFGTALAQKAR